MDSAILDLGEDLRGFLATLGHPVELYRRSLASSGKAAELLGIFRLEFIQRAAELGIPYFSFTEAEWRAEVAESTRFCVPVISNSSPLIALAPLGRLDLLRRLHIDVSIPATVAREVRPTLSILPDWLLVQELVS